MTPGRRNALLGVAALSAVAGAWFNRKDSGPPAASVAQEGPPTPAQIDATLKQWLHTARLPDAQGQIRPLADFRQRPLLINFWATWCPPCIEEMPELSDLYRELSQAAPPQRVEFLGIAIDSAPKVAEFAQRRQITYPLLVAGAGALDLVLALGNTSGGLPFSLFVDEQDRVAQQHLGRLDMAAVRATLGRLSSS